MALFVWMPIAFVDYGSSMGDLSGSTAVSEANAVSRVRALADAESNYIESQHDANAKGSLQAGTIPELRKAGLIDARISGTHPFGGYDYGELIGPEKGAYLFYTVPAFTASKTPYWWHAVPGGTLISKLFRVRTPEATGVRSFAVDESGVIRYAVRDISKPITREEAEHWDTLQ